jgi:hypothetical protein
MSEVENFFTDGEAYERRMGRWSRIVGEAFLDWLAVPNGLRWIDVGCGNGAFTEVLIARCAPSAVSAVDPSEGGSRVNAQWCRITGFRAQREFPRQSFRPTPTCNRGCDRRLGAASSCKGRAAATRCGYPCGRAR